MIIWKCALLATVKVFVNARRFVALTIAWTANVAITALRISHLPHVLAAIDWALSPTDGHILGAAAADTSKPFMVLWLF